ncbi:MAG: nucleotidyltransferase domain-containing protein [Candidatus Heimdallarchaeota archaeon]
MNQKIDDKNWDPLLPEDVLELLILELLSGIDIPWWIAGGWVIDLFLGLKTRDHYDIDVQILRKDQLILQSFLSDWDLYKTNQPGLKPWIKDEFLQIGVNSIWCRKQPTSPWKMEVLLLDTEGDKWFYRRKPSIRGFISEISLKTKTGIPYLSPEIQLLFKAQKIPTQKDEQDFLNILPYLERDKLLWLKEKILVQFGINHDWLKEIKKVP